MQKPYLIRTFVIWYQSFLYIKLQNISSFSDGALLWVPQMCFSSHPARKLWVQFPGVSEAFCTGHLNYPLSPWLRGPSPVSSCCPPGWRPFYVVSWTAPFLKVWHLGNTHPHPLVGGCAAHSRTVIPLSSPTRRATRSQQLTFKLFQKRISPHILQTRETCCRLQVVLWSPSHMLVIEGNRSHPTCPTLEGGLSPGIYNTSTVPANKLSLMALTASFIYP